MAAERSPEVLPERQRAMMCAVGVSRPGTKRPRDYGTPYPYWFKRNAERRKA